MISRHLKKIGKSENIWLKLGVALVLAGQGMVFGLGLNTADPPPVYGGRVYLLLHGGLIISSLVVFILLGPGLTLETWKSIREKKVTVDALFLLSISGAFIGSLISTVTGRGSVYYEVVAILLTVYTFGKLMSVRSQRKAICAAEQLREDFNWAWEIRHHQERRRIPVSELCPTSSLVSVHEGEPITVDGIIQNGTGFGSETSLTGEPNTRCPATRGFNLSGDSFCRWTVYDQTESIAGNAKTRFNSFDGRRGSYKIFKDPGKGGWVDALVPASSRIRVCDNFCRMDSSPFHRLVGCSI